MPSSSNKPATLLLLVAASLFVAAVVIVVMDRRRQEHEVLDLRGQVAAMASSMAEQQRRPPVPHPVSQEAPVPQSTPSMPSQVAAPQAQVSGVDAGHQYSAAEIRDNMDAVFVSE